MSGPSEPGLRAAALEKTVVPILYRMRAFHAFVDFSDFVESITSAHCKTCQ